MNTWWYRWFFLYILNIFSHINLTRSVEKRVSQHFGPFIFRFPGTSTFFFVRLTFYIYCASSIFRTGQWPLTCFYEQYITKKNIFISEKIGYILYITRKRFNHYHFTKLIFPTRPIPTILYRKYSHSNCIVNIFRRNIRLQPGNVVLGRRHKTCLCRVRRIVCTVGVYTAIRYTGYYVRPIQHNVQIPLSKSTSYINKYTLHIRLGNNRLLVD